MLLGVDVGGTCTDAVLLDGDRLGTAKSPTTPDDQSEGVLAAVRAALSEAGAAPADVERFVHGMTVATNALLEGRTARTALLATEGFTDIEELRRQNRASLYKLCAGHPAPIVPPELRVAVPERMGPGGVVRGLDEDALRERIAALPADCDAAATTGEREVGGRPLALPMVDVHTVGAGGGSIAWRDAGGALRVGPQSAGAEPGPAAYGRGGSEPTVTDANLLSGLLSADSPL